MASPLSTSMSTPLSGMPVGAANTLSLDALKSAAARDPKAAIKETAKQFEAIFMQQVMKSMREATVSSGTLENSATQLGTEMLDAQYANKMTGLPGGLADAIARQLERQMGGTTAAKPLAPASAAGASSASSAPSTPLSQAQSDFVQSHQAAALAAQAQSGIPAAFMIGQAAHESGWGKRDIKNADGSDSHNLFGVKAGAGWSGPVAQITTTEYVGGEAQKVTAKFRAYASDADAFSDYARMMTANPRYSGVAAQAAVAPASAASASDFAHGLQRAGYATDPAYADKLSRVINTTLRVQRASA
jgi:flagellar protein FlgJ